MPKAHPFAKASFILSLLFWLPALNFMTNALSIIFGIVALREIKATKQAGRHLAIAGISISALGMVFAIAGAVIYYLRVVA